MKSRQKTAATLALLSWMATVLGPIPAQAGRHQNADVTLVSFGSMQGELVTCGCHASPKGGLARRAAIIDSLEAAKNPFLHLELGDFSKIDDITGDYETRFIWSILEKTGVRAISPGPRELTMWNTFAELANESGIPVIASNLTVMQNGKKCQVCRPFQMYKVGGLKVAVIALLGQPELASARPPEGAEITVKDPLETARELVGRLHRKADLVVLMSQMGTGATDQVIREVPGIDVALYGQRPGWEEEAKRIGQTIVNQTGTRGQYVGELTLVIDPRSEIIDFGSRNFALDNSVAEDPEVVALVAAAQEKAKEMRGAFRREQTARSADSPPAGSATTTPAESR